MQATRRRKKKSNEVVVGTIDKVLNQVFGKEATALIYSHLECSYALKRSDISGNIELFAQGLEDFLRIGAHVIERKILEEISSENSSLHRTELENVGEEADFVVQMKVLMHKP